MSMVRDLIKSCLVIFAVAVPINARADSPSPTFQNVTVLGTINGGTPLSLITVASGSLPLPPSSAYLRIVNSTGGNLTITPANAPAEGTTITLIDWGGNAATYSWVFQGTLNGISNPTINTVNGGLCTLVYSAHGGWGTSP